MLVHYNGDRVKLAVEYHNPEDMNNTQQPFQPVNQQAKPQSPAGGPPVTAKGVNPASSVQPQSRPQTPTIYNPTLARMGIQLPPPKNPTDVTTKLSNAISRRLEKTSFLDKKKENFENLTVRDTMKHRDYFDSPYLTDLEHARLKVRAPIIGESDRLHGNMLGLGGATTGALAGLVLGRGFLGKGLGATLGAGVGFLGGQLYNKHRIKSELAQYEPYLYLNKDV